MPDHLVFIGIGSNLEQPLKQVQAAIEELADIPNAQLEQASSLYRSSPMGPQDQPDYINAVARLNTGLEPLALLDELQKIENRHGRVRHGERWGPRTLDLDLLLYDDQVLDVPRLRIPHPGLHERAFVLYPLSEISPELTIPGKGALSMLLAACPSDGLEKIII